MSRYNQLSMYKTSIRSENGWTIVRYHQTDILKFNPEQIVLRNGGYQTVTTKRKLSQASHYFNLGYSIWQRDFTWYVQLPDGREVEFEDGMTIDRTQAPSIAPTEAETEYNRDLALRVRNSQVGSGMKLR